MCTIAVRMTCIAAFTLAANSVVFADSFVGPSGQSVHTVKCNSSPTECYREANQTCRGPYQVTDSDSHAGGILADILPGPITWYGMTFSCGKSDGRMPSFAFRGQRQQQIAPPSYRPPTTTNCTRIGNMLNCQSY
jgi:hypothetical protein